MSERPTISQGRMHQENQRLSELVMRDGRVAKEILFEVPTCAICLIELSQDLHALKCGHVFHKVCINKNLQYRSKCPICKQTIRHIGVNLFFSSTEREFFIMGSNSNDSNSLETLNNVWKLNYCNLRQAHKQLKIQLTKTESQYATKCIQAQQASKLKQQLKDCQKKISNYLKSQQNLHINIKRLNQTISQISQLIKKKQLQIQNLKRDNEIKIKNLNKEKQIQSQKIQEKQRQILKLNQEKQLQNRTFKKEKQFLLNQFHKQKEQSIRKINLETQMKVKSLNEEKRMQIQKLKQEKLLEIQNCNNQKYVQIQKLNKQKLEIQKLKEEKELQIKRLVDYIQSQKERHKIQFENQKSIRQYLQMESYHFMNQIYSLSKNCWSNFEINEFIPYIDITNPYQISKYHNSIINQLTSILKNQCEQNSTQKIKIKKMNLQIQSKLELINSLKSDIVGILQKKRIKEENQQQFQYIIYMSQENFQKFRNQPKKHSFFDQKHQLLVSVLRNKSYTEPKNGQNPQCNQNQSEIDKKYISDQYKEQHFNNCSPY